MLETPRIVQNGNSYHASYGSDVQLVVEFSMEPELQEFESQEAGHPIYKDTAFITIITPGGRNSHKRRVKTESDASGPADNERFPKQWEAFKNLREQTPEGTPLTEWAPLSKSEALNYKYFKVYTVEQLAALSDAQIGSLPLGTRERREKAKAWLAQAIDASHITKLMARIEALETDNQMLKEQRRLDQESEIKPPKIKAK